ncbi:WD repeat-containing protein 6 [Patella vulgata]|uniref:WD repeat-containing protein 6 n=1 Tax=Patella vulgata TaxID=6465 RepID=UPI0024A8FB0A|nr:WD repeat-containing protein 6 [Patella vulgata]
MAQSEKEKMDIDMYLVVDYQTGPVTSLSILSHSTVVAGICGDLHFYDVNKQSLVHTEHSLLMKQNIHGIRKHICNDVMLCVFGGKGIRVLFVECSEGIFTRIKSLCGFKELEDWILEACWLERGEESTTVAIGLAHNVVINWDWETQTIISRVDCTEKCILYSAYFVGRTWQELVLAAGTVFNQIVLWSPTGQVNSNGQREVIHRLDGHQAIIFSMHYLPTKQILASASDDRSIRLWKLNLKKNPSAACDWLGVTSEPMLTLYGHSARVWSAQLLENKIISIGEDSTCCVWNYQGDILQKFKGHKGKSIWSLDVSEKNSFIVTGGGDNSIRLWRINSFHSPSASTVLTVLQIPSNLKVDTDDIPRSVVLKNYNEALIMTNAGSLFHYNLSQNIWQLLHHDPSFKSYSLIVTSPDEQLTVVGNIEGDIRVFSKDNCICERIFNGKVFSLIWVDLNDIVATGPDGNVILLSVIYNEDHQLVLHHKAVFTLPVCKQRWVCAGQIVCNGQVLICGDRGGTIHSYQIQNTKDPIQSFPKIHGKAGVTCISSIGQKIYSAGRDGHYRIWTIDQDGCLELLNSNKVLKGLEWIDRLVFIDNKLQVYGFHSTSFVIWSEVDNQLLVEIECGGGHRSWDCKLKGQEAKFLYIKNGDVILHNASLQSNQLILKSALHGREICDMRCITSLYTNISKCIYHVIVTSSEDTTINISLLKYKNGCHALLQPLHTMQGHLSSVRTLSTSTVKNRHENITKCLLFSGGGRAQIEVWKINVSESENNEISFNSDAFEINSNSETCPLNCDYEHLTSTFLGQVKNKRGLKSWKKNSYNPDPETRILCLTSFPATEIDITNPNNLHFIGAACSDGFVRLFGFDEKTNTMSLIDQSDYHNNCVLKIHYFIHQSEQGTHIFLLSGATEGVIAIWDITTLCFHYIKCNNFQNVNENKSSDDQNCDITNYSLQDDNLVEDASKKDYFPERTKIISVKKENSAEVTVQDWQPCFTIKCHQSGINSIDILSVSDSEYLLASGGDDNSLTVHKLILLHKTSPIQFQVVKTGSEVTAHAAQITGVKILSPDKLLTVSVDQRMTIWSVTETNTDIKLKYNDREFINVSDVANIDVWKFNDNIYYGICGDGLAYGHITEKDK